MGNSASTNTEPEQNAEEFDLPAEFGLITEDGLPLNKKARKALTEIRNIMETKQPIATWQKQLVSVNNYLEERRFHAMKDADVQHASRLQRKLRASPRERIWRRSTSAPERLRSLSRREYINGLSLKLSRTVSVLEIELANWFGVRVDDLAQKAYLKYLAVNPLVDEFQDSDDEEAEILEYSNEEEEEEETDVDESCKCQCHHHNCDPSQSSDNDDPAREEFIKNTMSHVLEFKKLLGDRAMSSRKKSERNAHAAKINDTVKSFIQHTTSHFFKKFNIKNHQMVTEKVTFKEEKVPTLTKEEKLLSLRKKIAPYKGRSSSRIYFNEFFEDFLLTHDECECKFMTERDGEKTASLMELAIHAQHHLQSVENVKDLFLEMLRDAPSEIKGCPLEMQLMYQCFANSLLDEDAMEAVLDYDGDDLEITKESENGEFEKITATFEAPGINFSDETFEFLPREVQNAMKKMMHNSNKMGRVVVRQSITVNRQATKKTVKK